MSTGRVVGVGVSNAVGVGVVVTGLLTRRAFSVGSPAFKLNNGNGKADAVYRSAAVSLLYSGCVDANHLAFAVDKRTAAVARIYRRIRLQQVNAIRNSGGGDNTSGYGQAIANSVCKRKAERKHLIAHPYAIRISNRDRMETIIAVYLHQREVGSCVSLQHISLVEASVGQPDTHAARSTYNMLIGYDQPVRIDNEARSTAAVCRNLYYTRLNAFDELRERRFALVGQVGSPNEVDIGLWCVRGRR